MHSRDLTFSALPVRMPIFPLTGVLLLPYGQLPLNIFEPRYITMIDDALAADRMIGMIQPKGGNGGGLYDIGCAGRIVNFSESDDGRYLITLSGVCRFKIAADITDDKPYRSVKPEWLPFARDMDAQAETVAVDRTRLNRLLQAYFKQQEMSCDWDKVDIAPDADLLTALAMICPLKASEKQALLESPDVQTRTELFMTVLEMAASQVSTADDACCH